MKINGISLGSATILSGLLILNLDRYFKESIIGTLIVLFICLGCWYFSFDNDYKSSRRARGKR